MNIPLSSPDLSKQDIEAVVEVLHSRQLSLGPKLEAFERHLAAYSGVKHAVALNSGTSALHLCVRALGLHAGDEVITTPFSFVASSNCLLFERVKPVFVDIDPLTYNLDLDRVEAAIGPQTRAILAVDVFGLPCDWDRLNRIAARHDLRLIEDSAEAIGARYKGRPAGSLGEIAVFAFYPNKQMTTGEGGAVVTDDANLASLCRSMRNQGRAAQAGWLQHERLGFNYRLSELNCALGLSQLARLDAMLAQRARVARWYEQRLADVSEVILPRVVEGVERSWFVYVLRLADRFSQADRDRVIEGLRAKGIGCSNYFVPIHLQPFYREMGWGDNDFPHTERVAARTLALPFYNRLSEDQVQCVVQALKALLAGMR